MVAANQPRQLSRRLDLLLAFRLKGAKRFAEPHAVRLAGAEDRRDQPQLNMLLIQSLSSVESDEATQRVRDVAGAQDHRQHLQPPGLLPQRPFDFPFHPRGCDRGRRKQQAEDVGAVDVAEELLVQLGSDCDRQDIEPHLATGRFERPFGRERLVAVARAVRQEDADLGPFPLST
jgi:hypothetical protein